MSDATTPVAALQDGMRRAADGLMVATWGPRPAGGNPPPWGTGPLDLTRGKLAVRTRNLILAAASAAAGLAALGTVAAQQPRSPSALPATTVRPYAEWTP